jgi:hypothetical protein
MLLIWLSTMNLTVEDFVICFVAQPSSLYEDNYQVNGKQLPEICVCQAGNAVFSISVFIIIRGVWTQIW